MASALCVNPMAATAASFATSSAAAKPAPSFTEVAPPKAPVKVSPVVVRRRSGPGFVFAHVRSSRLAVRARAREQQLCATQTGEGKSPQSGCNAGSERGRSWAVYSVQDTASPAAEGGLLSAELTQDGRTVCPSTETTFELKTGRVEQEPEAGGFGFGFAPTSETSSTGRAAATGLAALLVIELVTGVGTWTKAAYSLPFFSPPPVDQPPPAVVVPAPAPVIPAIPNFPSLPNVVVPSLPNVVPSLPDVVPSLPNVVPSLPNVVPSLPSFPNVVPNFPNLVAPEILPSGVKYQLTTLPIDRSQVSDGDTLNVYVDVASDVASAGPVPTTVLQAVDARRAALAQRDDKAAEALRKQIEKSGYKVFDAQFGRPEVLAHKYRVRLRGVDAPEKQMPYGIESRDFFAGLVDGKPLRVLVYNTDFYGRAVADVYLQGTFVQETLLRSGTVWHYLAYDKRPELDQWEQQARQSHVGLWAQPNPQEPWEFRKAKRAASAASK